MLEWLKEYYVYILAGISLISILLNIIILVIKHVPLSRIVKVISLVPSLITQAEKIFLISNNGSNKKEIVRQLYDKLLNDYGVAKYSKYIDIDNLIEEILKTPTKKGE